jgi:hypothetical protein
MEFNGMSLRGWEAADGAGPGPCSVADSGAGGAEPEI